MNFLYRDILLTLIHSIWQSGMLCLFLFLYTQYRKSASPGKLRLISLSLLFSQVAISIVSFLIIREESLTHYINSSFYESVNALVTQDFAKIVLLFHCLIFVFIQSRSHFKWKSFSVELSKGYIEPSESFLALTQKHQIKLRFRNSIAYYFHENIPTPMTFGFWKPIIVFPIALVNQLDPDETESLILHELQHIIHHDFLFLRAIELIKNIYFFNPFIALLKKSAEANMELSCDHMVLKHQGNMIAYAIALQKTAGFSIMKFSIAAAKAIGNEGAIVSRIRQFPELIKKDAKITFSAWPMLPYALIVFIMSFFSHQPISSVSMKNNINIVQTAKTVVSKSIKATIKNRTTHPVMNQEFLRNPVSNEQSDFFQISANPSSFTTNYSSENKAKQITIEEETAGTGVRTTSSFLILDENGVAQNTWLWSVEETIETTDSIYSDTLVQYQEYVEDLR